MKVKPLVSIMLAVRNEAEHLPIAVGVIYAVLSYPHEILVIYDFPEDNTIPIAKKLQKKFPNLKLIHNKDGHGLTNAYKAGISKAEGKYIALIPTDDSAPTPSVNAAVKLLIDGCNFVSGTRYANGGKRIGGSKIGAVLSRVANNLFYLMTGTYSDLTTGFKIFEKSVFDKLLPASIEGGSMFIEMSLNAAVSNLKIGEVPFISIDRLYGGTSTFRLLKWIKAYLPLFVRGLLIINHSKKIKRLRFSEISKI